VRGVNRGFVILSILSIPVEEMIDERLTNVHPGDILRDELEVRLLTAYRLAKELHLDYSGSVLPSGFAQW
jgi:hypothetical protein